MLSRHCPAPFCAHVGNKPDGTHKNRLGVAGHKCKRCKGWRDKTAKTAKLAFLECVTCGHGPPLPVPPCRLPCCALLCLWRSAGGVLAGLAVLCRKSLSPIRFPPAMFWRVSQVSAVFPCNTPVASRWHSDSWERHPRREPLPLGKHEPKPLDLYWQFFLRSQGDPRHSRPNPCAKRNQRVFSHSDGISQQIEAGKRTCD